MRGAFYNEIDPYAAAWLRNLIDAGHIAPGVVDERSIVDIDPDELAGYTQCHFFAGIGVWSYALRLAGWPDDRPVWTGSCPCQPFSAAGKRGGHEDERHLWPAWFGLISERRPVAVFGEQVASADGLAWLDAVCTDMEGAGYAIGAADFPAAGVGAPHIRQRLWFVANSQRAGVRGDEHRSPRSETGSVRGEVRQQRIRADAGPGSGGVRALANAGAPGLRVIGRRGLDLAEDAGPHADEHHEGSSSACAVANTELHDRAGRLAQPHGRSPLESDRHGAAGGFWSAADWIACRDGKARPVEPGTFPLAHGAPARVGRLRAYGNAINAQAARAFIEAAEGCLT